MGAADAAFEHAAVPHRNAVRGAQVMELDRGLVAAHPSRLDVDDPARLRVNRVARDAHRVDRLVQADRRLDARLQHRVVHYIVVVERLLDQQQVERIEARQQGRVLKRVGGVGVDLQGDVAELRADALDRRDVPSGLDLDLDALVTGGQLLLDLLQQLVEGVLDADRNARGNAIAGTAEDLRERLPLEPRVQIPDGHLDAGLRHVMAADAPQRRVDVARVLERPAHHQRRNEALDDVPHGIGGFTAVVRVGLGDRLAPSLLALAFNADQHEGAIVRTAKARFEKLHQRQPAQEQLNPLDFH